MKFMSQQTHGIDKQISQVKEKASTLKRCQEIGT